VLKSSNWGHSYKKADFVSILILVWDKCI
jgi:hypothetical protein